ncbi:MAG: DUF1667 domain-containing protein [Clostridiaceae bacterium]|nr:DUF1667 domain-containing protein [Clostridia bacterium]MDD7291991.1 DUF1667 domain-containing protein [Clostridiaceae bacterium]MDY5990535.1 DUF1667 domain-containing protein [Oscillospiraceae bacterium]
MKRELVCVSCPIGCALSVELSEDGKEVLSVSGNTCKRGDKYARDECTNPVRMLTSTIRVNGGNHPVVPVKTSAPIPKGMMFECMKAINNEVVDAPVKIGEVLISNVCDTGVDIVATNEM